MRLPARRCESLQFSFCPTTRDVCLKFCTFAEYIDDWHEDSENDVVFDFRESRYSTKTFRCMVHDIFSSISPTYPTDTKVMQSGRDEMNFLHMILFRIFEYRVELCEGIDALAEKYVVLSFREGIFFQNDSVLLNFWKR